MANIDLSHFWGTENYYRWGFGRNRYFTDGVKYLADKAECYWLVDYIFLHHPKEEFQVWTLTLDKSGNGAVLKGDDGNGNIFSQEEIPFTDFPLPEIKLYLQNGSPGWVLMLTSEY